MSETTRRLPSDDATGTVRERIAADPVPALLWTVGLLALLAMQFASVVETLILFGDQINPFASGLLDAGGWFAGILRGTFAGSTGTAVAIVVLGAGVYAIAANRGPRYGAVAGGLALVLLVLAPTPGDAMVGVFALAGLAVVAGLLRGLDFATILIGLTAVGGYVLGARVGHEVGDLPVVSPEIAVGLLAGGLASLAAREVAARYEAATLRVDPGLLEQTVVMVLVGVLVAALLDGTVAASTKALTDGVAGIATGFTDLPTLLTRELIPSDGYYRPGVGWMETFPQNLGLGAGLAPAHAWAVRVLAVYTYAFVLLAWVWKGYTLFRDRYRYADWTPRDDVVRRLRGHYWGQFGMIVVIAFIVFALFAPTLGPTTVEDNIYNPYGNTFEYYDDGAGEVVEITHGTANRDTISQGDNANVGPLSYDQYGRWHPFGTLTSGKDLFTFMAAGARVSLFIAILALLIAGGVGATMALVTAYYKGLLDLGTVVASDSVQSIPGLVALILLSEVFSGHPLANVYNGGFLLALFIGLISWPAYWRAIRGPAFQVAEKEWIDAAKSFGQRPTTTMRKHIAPYVVGYLLIYASLAIGGVIISVAALSFLGLGVNPPTPEWGRAVNAGRPYISTASWHIATIPGVMVVIVVTGFNALGDGIRDAIDPQSDTGESGAAATAGGG